MDNQFLYEKLDIIKEACEPVEIPDFINRSLSEKIELRDYQKEAFRNFISYYENDKLRKNKQLHTLFHMATGSGKTVIMAGLILYMYMKGYRRFLFFVNQTNVVEKTIENFTNPFSGKYLFNDIIEYLGNKVRINKVDNFSQGSLDDEIEIIFTTTQKLHMDLLTPKENAITYEVFEDNKIVFISDESHHVNSLTKKLSKEQETEKASWEYSVTHAFCSNKDNVMLEFTATCDLKDKNVRNKYLDKIVFNYPLISFRESGFTKDFQNFATDTDLWKRALMALVLSEYRKYLFADLKLNIKPVIMFKSQIIKESEEFYDEFFRKLNNLSGIEILGLEDVGIDLLKEAIGYFKEKDESLELLVNSLKNSFKIDTSIIMNKSTDSNIEKRLLVNSLEDKDNPIRSIFTVDMLNEGWDVLNLFDIVRLHDTRQGSGKAGKIGSYTIKEAQLIGRGARYCPFVLDDEELKFKRKYDNDLDNKYRILETMYFHSKNDSRYIAELKAALIETGLQSPDPIILEYKLKESFKDTDFYKEAFVFSNKRVPKGRADVQEIEHNLRKQVYRYKAKSGKGKIHTLFGEDKDSRNIESKFRSIAFKDIDTNILLGALDCYSELRFNLLKARYPTLKSKLEFLVSENFLGDSKLEIEYYENNIHGRDIFLALKKALGIVVSQITALKQEFVGTREFHPHLLKAVIKDKKIYLTSIARDGGKGESQIHTTAENYQLDLSQEHWYVFNDNYGTNEEKLLVKYFKNYIEPKLIEKNVEYYLVRNERVPELAVYTFDTGERFEPDFILFVRRKNTDNSYLTYQGYIEPKGIHLLERDSWKNEFLLDSLSDYVINTLTSNEYQIIGFPFFNNEVNLESFESAIEDFLNRI